MQNLGGQTKSIMVFSEVSYSIGTLKQIEVLQIMIVLMII